MRRRGSHRALFSSYFLPSTNLGPQKQPMLDRVADMAIHLRGGALVVERAHRRLVRKGVA